MEEGEPLVCKTALLSLSFVSDSTSIVHYIQLAMEKLADAILLDPRVVNFPNLQDRADFFNQIHWQA